MSSQRKIERFIVSLCLRILRGEDTKWQRAGTTLFCLTPSPFLVRHTMYLGISWNEKNAFNHLNMWYIFDNMFSFPC